MAAVCETLHNASLIHDDLQDQALERRGRGTVWHRYSPELAICLGDLLISAAYGALAEVDPDCDVSLLLRETHRAVAKAVHGQATDLRLSRSLPQPDAILAQYLATARAKSGAMLSLTLILPLAASGYLGYLEQARKIGEDFAVGYQILDDLADVAEDLEGKSRPFRLNFRALFPEEMEPMAIEGRARTLARQAFDSAACSARLLPEGSGDALADLAHRLCGRD